MMLYRSYRKVTTAFEYCFYVLTTTALNSQELMILKWLLSETFDPQGLADRSSFENDARVVEVGPRLNFATAFSTNAVAICRACGLTQVVRLERSRRYLLMPGTDPAIFTAQHHDRMTECPYPSPLQTFATGIVPEKVYVIPLQEQGMEALKTLNQEMGLGMDQWDLDYYFNLFVHVLKRDPTIVELFQIAQANSEHSRHHFFKGKLVINGEEMPSSLLDLIKSTWEQNPSNSLIAFSDNSSAIQGFNVSALVPRHPGMHSPYTLARLFLHPTFSAETHNFPSGVAPFPGAETGTGGRIRDINATGRGAFVIAGTAGYCTGNLNIAGYPIPGEDRVWLYPANLASPLEIMIQASNGASDYGNKFGEPLINGFARTFGLPLPDDERREWNKPIMFTGGIGQIANPHLRKEEPEKGMLIVAIGGPAYRIGVGGGSASSMVQGENREELDFNAVQRGDAEMENKMNRIVRACVEMGSRSPILNIHDQGAGGPCNVLTELVYPAGGKINIRKIFLGDETLSVLEIWGAEYQERDALLIWPHRIMEFQAICSREKVNCEILGEITDEGTIVVYDEKDDSTPVNLDLKNILGAIPPKKFRLERVPPKREPLRLLPLTVLKALESIFKLPSVGSKGFLVRKVDRSVSSLIGQQQCCGPLQLPVSDYAVVAQSHFEKTGAAIAIGEQPIKVLLDPPAGARMALGEALTNIIGARITHLTDIKCSVNWMCAAKLPGEGALLWDAALALTDLMKKIGIAADGGKDSLSMAAQVGNEMVKCPPQVVISVYATMADITCKVTPDLKAAGASKLLFIDLAQGKNRLGGSALAQACGQIGDQCPDVEDPDLLVRTFTAVQEMIAKELILSCHDRSDGGLITTMLEMAMAGNCGLNVELPSDVDTIPFLFSEELGLVVEYLPAAEKEIRALLPPEIPWRTLAETKSARVVKIEQGPEPLLESNTPSLLDLWEQTSDQLERQQMNPALALVQAQNHNRLGPQYQLSFRPELHLIGPFGKPRVAILREEGSNGDREMAAAFLMAGFEPWDVTMTDLLEGRVTLEQFRGLVFVGGFSYADVLDAAKGWAGIIRFNPKLKAMFDAFYHRPDTFSLGVCNGCQLMALLGWVPWVGIPETQQPRFIRNPSRRFESRWVTVQILESPAMMLQGMAGSILGIWVAHGEGQLFCPNPAILNQAQIQNLTPIVFVDDSGIPTAQYPFNPNGSPFGITALCSRDGRHLGMMPHPERAFLLWQWPWIPQDWKQSLTTSPWLKMFQNAREWCINNP